MCFNAATARSPWRTGKIDLGELFAALLQCGHGSVAVENLVRGDWRTAVPEASMRPRLGRRGERWWKGSTISYSLWLQCGHGSVAVENRCRLTAAACGSLLQCGHGSVAVENSLTGDDPYTAPEWLQCGHGSVAVENF